MDPVLILFRVVHVGAAMTWFGGAIVSSFFLQPTVDALRLDWMTSPSGLAFGMGGLAAFVAFVGGGVLIGPAVAEQTTVRGELAQSGVEPTPEQRARLDRADGKLKLASRIDLPLLLFAGLTMAVGRYL